MPISIAPGVKRDWASSNFDSHLILDGVSETRNAELLIEARVHFHRDDSGQATDAEGGRHTLVPWGSHAVWLDWVNRCKAAIETSFNGARNAGRMWLFPHSDWGVRFTSLTARREPTGPLGYYRPNIKCLLRVIPVAEGQRKHLWVDCYRVPPSYCPASAPAMSSANTFVSYMRSTNLGYRDNYGRIVNVDAWDCVTHQDEGHVMEVAAHEFAHFLGLDHVGKGSIGCPPSRPNALGCYGTTYHSRGDLTGFGHRVEGHHTVPWIRRLSRHVAGSVSWSGITTRIAPIFVEVLTPGAVTRHDRSPAMPPRDAGV
jgi:hypothetical protein